VYSDLETTEDHFRYPFDVRENYNFFCRLLAELLTVSLGGVVNRLFKKLLTNSFFNLRLIALKINLRE